VVREQKLVFFGADSDRARCDFQRLREAGHSRRRNVTGSRRLADLEMIENRRTQYGTPKAIGTGGDLSRNHRALSVIRDVIFDGMPLATISVAVTRRGQDHDMGTVAGGVMRV